MWTLIVLVLTTTITTATVDKYSTQELCLISQLRWEKEFLAAYPGDNDYIFACLQPKPNDLPDLPKAQE